MNRLLSLAFWLLPFVALSQPPAPRPLETAQNNQTKKDTKGNESATSDKSKKATSTLTTSEHDNRSNHTSTDSPSNWWLIVPTIVIAVATGVQAYIYCRQSAYMQRGLKIAMKQARIAAKSAQSAKYTAEATMKSFIATHRPRLTVRFGNVQCEEGRMRVLVGFMVFNIGTTDAIMRRWHAELVIAPHVPPVPPWIEVGPVEEMQSILASGQGQTLEFSRTFDTHGDYSKFWNAYEKKEARGHQSYLMGWIEYADGSGQLRKMTFCRKYDFATNRFVPTNDKEYESDD